MAENRGKHLIKEFKILHLPDFFPSYLAGRIIWILAASLVCGIGWFIKQMALIAYPVAFILSAVV